MSGNAHDASRPEHDKVILPDLLLTALALTVDVSLVVGEDRLRGGGPVPNGVLPAMTTAVMATLLLRRRHPVGVLSVQVVYALLVVGFIPTADPIAGVLVALYAVASRREPSWSVPGLLAVAVLVNAQLLSWAEETSFDGAWLVALLAGLLVLAVWAAGYRAWTAQARLSTLKADHQAAKARTVREERLRIARELHDIVASSVSIMVVQAAGAQAVLRTDVRQADLALAVIQRAGTQSMAELRRLLGLLRSAGEGIDNEDPGPGIDGLEELMTTMRGVGLTVSFRVTGDPALIDPSVSLACYRVVQEALTNTVKHAGPGSTAEVHLAWKRGSLTVEVSDQGGHAPADGQLSTGHGLLGIRERVGALGGVFTAGRSADGFVVRAVLPVASEAPLLAARALLY